MHKIFVTQPALPPINEYSEYLKQIWESKILTNNGPFHQQFEKELADFLGVKYISLFSNGTMALITALQALNIKGEVITTPYSFVATTHSLWWNNIKPVFVDIEPVHYNIDPARIEAAITPHTTAMMPVHVYGNPCNVEAIQKIAVKYGLKVVYDAAHAFAVKSNGNSVMNYGDLAVLSFHATKVFNTIEGGAIVSHEETMKKRIDYLKNFGFEDEVTVVTPGINAKMNELQAALGLLQLKYVDGYIQKRKRVVNLYRELLSDIPGILMQEDIEDTESNYAYLPILIDAHAYGRTRDEVYDILKENEVFARRYFYPLISQFPSYSGLLSAKPENLPVATRVSGQVICLPVFPDLSKEDITRICNILKK
jgi:dTDP-4-amino-4,6-dideoxygalactose transaminase